jgi:hypothetical protein
LPLRPWCPGWSHAEPSWLHRLGSDDRLFLSEFLGHVVKLACQA